MHTSRDGILLKLYKDWRNFRFWIFAKVFSFSLTWDHMGEKTSNDILSEIAQQICSQNFMHIRMNMKISILKFHLHFHYSD